MVDSSVNQEMTAKLNHIEEIHTVNNIENKMESELNSFIESHDKRNKEDECTNKTMQRYLNNDVISFNKISCNQCKSSFKSEEMFENHKILCYVKETTVEKKKEINSNISSRDSNNTEINLQCILQNCNTCHKNFENEKHLIEHKLTYCRFFEEDQYKLCNKSHGNEEQYGSDKDVCTTINIELIETNKKCGHCDIIFNTKKELLSHITQCHKSQLLLKCMICDRSYEKWSSLDVHEATHRIDKPYLCDLCGKSFKHSNNLRGHKRTHLDDSKKKRHICEICGNAFRSR